MNRNILKLLKELEHEISLIDVEVTAEEIQAEMVRVGGHEEFVRGWWYAHSMIPRAVRVAKEKRLNQREESAREVEE
jgi:hypothetical protein